MYLRYKQFLFSGFRSIITPVRVFMISTMVVNGGNYLYNLCLGRYLSPSQFAEAGFIVTLLLIFSFLGMTFQVVSTKYSIDFEGDNLVYFKKWITTIGLISGVVLAMVMLLFSKQISVFFNMSDYIVIPIFILALPLYFIMSVYRGFRQGREGFIELSMSYQVETWGRFIVTFVLLYFLENQVGISVAAAIVVSIVFGTLVIFSNNMGKILSINFDFNAVQKIAGRFFIITAGYEVAQVLINYGDLLLVKHYFDSHQAGLYTSLSLIGKMIYFVTWMVVMILIPRILSLKKEGLPFKNVMHKYIFTVALFTLGITCVSFLFPEFIVTNFFGLAYIEVAGYLWQYALATSLFALSNMFVYYFLSIDQYVPVYIAIGIGVLQVCTFGFVHDSVSQVILVQIVFMSLLLGLQMTYFFFRSSVTGRT